MGGIFLRTGAKQISNIGDLKLGNEYSNRESREAISLCVCPCVCPSVA